MLGFERVAVGFQGLRDGQPGGSNYKIAVQGFWFSSALSPICTVRVPNVTGVQLEEEPMLSSLCFLDSSLQNHDDRSRVAFCTAIGSSAAVIV